MLTFRTRVATGKDIELKKFLNDERITLVVHEIGERQDDPGHKYHKPDKVLAEVSMSTRSFKELIQAAERML